MEDKKFDCNCPAINDEQCRTSKPMTKITFIDGCCFIDGKYQGKVIYGDSEIIQVECDNGNRYSRGQILTFVNPSTTK